MDGDSYALLIVWILFGIYVLYSLAYNYIMFPEKARAVFCKDCDPSEPETVRNKYLISIYLDNWTTNYNLKKTVIYFDLITKEQSKMVSFSLKGNDITNKRAYILLHRRKVLRPLTRIRMIHDCANARIHLSAIKVHDLTYGSIVYYSIDRNIHCEPMVSATVHNTSPLKLQFCSDHIFCPNFVQRTDTYSTLRIAYYSGQRHETNGAILSPELNGWEDMAFVIFLMISVFFFNVLFVIILKKNFELSTIPLIIVSVIMSSGLSFNSTNISALFYRKFIKKYYNIYCSPQMIDSEKDSVFWTLFKNLSITYLVCISIVVSFFTPYCIERVAKDKRYLSKWLGIEYIDDSLLNETAFLVSFFLISLFTSVTLWLIISGLIKYLYLKCCAVIKFIPFHTIVKFSDERTVSDDSQMGTTELEADTKPKDTDMNSKFYEIETKLKQFCGQNLMNQKSIWEPND